MYVRYVVMFMREMQLPRSAPFVEFPLPNSPLRQKRKLGQQSMLLV
jgi:hypothetical protein